MRADTLIQPLRMLWRGARLLVHVLLGFPLAWMFLRGEANQRQSFEAALIQWWLARVCRILHVQVEVCGDLPNRPALLVANHVSWLDIPVIATIWQGNFLSKAEVAEWPLIGHLLQKSGTLLVRRGSIASFLTSRDEMVSRLEQGVSIGLFPEGTSTHGKQVIPFRARYFETAMLARCPVQPLAIRYRNEDGGLNEKVAFIGHDTFLSNLAVLLRERRIYVTLMVLPEINAVKRKISPEAMHDLSEQAHAQVAAALAGECALPEPVRVPVRKFPDSPQGHRVLRRPSY